jgi:aspartyl/asparaginyl beta-hydroxylase (cupin superfamily)
VRDGGVVRTLDNRSKVMSIWKRSGIRRLRYIAGIPAILLPALYFVPIPTLALILCGVLDIRRHDKITWELIEKYFTGSGFITWMLSPINLLVDLLSHRNKIIFRLEDLPAEHRSEIEACVRGFTENGDAIKAHIAKALEQSKRCMLTFKWYNTTQITDLRIPAFERNYRYIKTIAVSVFNSRESTSRHFGPLRLSFRVLYNLEPIDSREVFIEVDGRVHYWVDNPLFIFDDTAFHRSVNEVDHVRYCLFMDIVRPNYAPAAFDVAVRVVSAVAGWFKWVFYKNWSFIR